MFLTTSGQRKKGLCAVLVQPSLWEIFDELDQIQMFIVVLYMPNEQEELCWLYVGSASGYFSQSINIGKALNYKLCGGILFQLWSF